MITLHQRGWQKAVSLFVIASFISWQTAWAEVFKIWWEKDPQGNWDKTLEEQKKTELDKLSALLNQHHQALAQEMIDGMFAQAQLAQMQNLGVEFQVNGQGEIVAFNFFEQAPGVAQGNFKMLEDQNFIYGVMSRIPEGSLVSKQITTEGDKDPVSKDVDQDGRQDEILSSRYEWRFTVDGKTFTVQLNQTFSNVEAPDNLEKNNQNLLTEQETIVTQEITPLTVEPVPPGDDQKIITVQLIQYTYDTHGRIESLTTTTQGDAGVITTSFDIRGDAPIGQFLQTLNTNGETALLNKLMSEYQVASLIDLEQKIKDRVGYDENTGQLFGRFVISEGPGRDGNGTTDGIKADLDTLTSNQLNSLYTQYGVNPANYSTPDEAKKALAQKIYDDKKMIVGVDGNTVRLESSIRDLTTASVEQTEYDAMGRLGFIESKTVFDDGRVENTLDLRDSTRVGEFLGRLNTNQVDALYQKYNETDGIVIGDKNALIAAIAKDIGYIGDGVGETPTGQLKGRMVISTTENQSNPETKVTKISQVNIEETTYDANGRVGVVVNTSVDNAGTRANVSVDLRDARRLAEILAKYGDNLPTGELDFSNLGYDAGSGLLTGRLVITQGETRDSVSGQMKKETRMSVENSEYDDSGRIKKIATKSVDDAGTRATTTTENRTYDEATGQVKHRQVISDTWTNNGSIVATRQTDDTDIEYDEHGRITRTVTKRDIDGQTQDDLIDESTRYDTRTGQVNQRVIQTKGWTTAEGQPSPVEMFRTDTVNLKYDQHGRLLQTVMIRNISGQDEDETITETLEYDRQTGQANRRTVDTVGSTNKDGQILSTHQTDYNTIEYDEHGRVKRTVTRRDINGQTQDDLIEETSQYDTQTGQVNRRIVENKTWTKDGKTEHGELKLVEQTDTVDVYYDEFGRIRRTVTHRDIDGQTQDPIIDETLQYDTRTGQLYSRTIQTTSYTQDGDKLDGQQLTPVTRTDRVDLRYDQFGRVIKTITTSSDGTQTTDPTIRTESLTYDTRTGQVQHRQVITQGTTRDGEDGTTNPIYQRAEIGVKYDEFGREAVREVTSFDDVGRQTDFSIVITDGEKVDDYILSDRLSEDQKAKLREQYGVTNDTDLIREIVARIDYDSDTGQSRGSFVITKQQGRNGVGSVVQMTKTLEGFLDDGIDDGTEGDLDNAEIAQLNAIVRALNIPGITDWDTYKNQAKFDGKTDKKILDQMAADLFVKNLMVTVSNQESDDVAVRVGTSLVDVTQASVEETRYDEFGRVGLILRTTVDDAGSDLAVSAELRDVGQLHQLERLLANEPGLLAQIQALVALVGGDLSGKVGYDVQTGELKGRLTVGETLNVDISEEPTPEEPTPDQITVITTVSIEQIEYDQFGRTGLIVANTLDDAGVATLTVDLRDARRVEEIKIAYGDQIPNLDELDTSKVGYDVKTGQLTGRLLVTQGKGRDGIGTVSAMVATLDTLSTDQLDDIIVGMDSDLEGSETSEWPESWSDYVAQFKTEEVSDEEAEQLAMKALANALYEQNLMVLNTGEVTDSLKNVTQFSTEDTTYDEHGQVGMIVRRTIDDAGSAPQTAVDLRDIGQLDTVKDMFKDDEDLLAQILALEDQFITIGYDPITGQLMGRLTVTQSPGRDGEGTYNAIVTDLEDLVEKAVGGDQEAINDLNAIVIQLGLGTGQDAWLDYLDSKGNDTAVAVSELGQALYDQELMIDDETGQAVNAIHDIIRTSVEDRSYDEHGREGLIVTTTIDDALNKSVTVDLRDADRVEEVLAKYAPEIDVDNPEHGLDLTGIGYNEVTGQLEKRLLITNGPGRDGSGSVDAIVHDLDQMGDADLEELLQLYLHKGLGDFSTRDEAEKALADELFELGLMIDDQDADEDGNTTETTTAIRDITRAATEKTQYDAHARAGLIETVSLDDANIWSRSVELRDPRRVDELLATLSDEQLTSLYNQYRIPVNLDNTSTLAAAIAEGIGYDEVTGQVIGQMTINQSLNEDSGDQGDVEAVDFVGTGVNSQLVFNDLETNGYTDKEGNLQASVGQLKSAADLKLSDSLTQGMTPEQIKKLREDIYQILKDAYQLAITNEPKGEVKEVSQVTIDQNAFDANGRIAFVITKTANDDGSESTLIDLRDGRLVGTFLGRLDSGTVTKQDFGGLGLDVEKLWEALIQDGYIDKNGVVQKNFKELPGTQLNKLFSPDQPNKKGQVLAILEHGKQIVKLMEKYDVATLEALIAEIEDEVGYDGATNQLSGRMVISERPTVLQGGLYETLQDLSIEKTDYDPNGRISAQETKTVRDGGTFVQGLSVRDERRVAEFLLRVWRDRVGSTTEQQDKIDRQINELRIKYNAQTDQELVAAIAKEIGYDVESGLLRGQFAIEISDNTSSSGSAEEIERTLTDIQAKEGGTKAIEDLLNSPAYQHLSDKQAGVSADEIKKLAKQLESEKKMIQFEMGNNGTSVKEVKVVNSLRSTFTRDKSDYDPSNRLGLVQSLEVDDDANSRERLSLRDKQRVRELLKELQTKGETALLDGMMLAYGIDRENQVNDMEELAQAIEKDFGYNTQTGQLQKNLDILYEKNVDGQGVVLKTRSSFEQFTNFFNRHAQLGRRLILTTDDSGTPLEADELYDSEFFGPERQTTNLNNSFDKSGKPIYDKNEVGYDPRSGQVVGLMRYEKRLKVGVSDLFSEANATSLSYLRTSGVPEVVIPPNNTASIFVNSGQEKLVIYVSETALNAAINRTDGSLETADGVLEFFVQGPDGTRMKVQLKASDFKKSQDGRMRAEVLASTIGLGMGWGKTYSVWCQYTEKQTNTNKVTMNQQVGGSFDVYYDPDGQLVAEDKSGVAGAQIELFNEETGEKVALINDPDVIAPEEIASAKKGSLISNLLGFFKGGILGEIVEGAKYFLKIVADGFKSVIIKGIELTKEILSQGLHFGVVQMEKGDSSQTVTKNYQTSQPSTTAQPSANDAVSLGNPISAANLTSISSEPIWELIRVLLITPEKGIALVPGLGIFVVGAITVFNSADVNHDGRVDQLDLEAVNQANSISLLDFNGDKKFDLMDFNMDGDGEVELGLVSKEDFAGIVTDPVALDALWDDLVKSGFITEGGTVLKSFVDLLDYLGKNKFITSNGTVLKPVDWDNGATKFNLNGNYTPGQKEAIFSIITQQFNKQDDMKVWQDLLGALAVGPGDPDYSRLDSRFDFNRDGVLNGADLEKLGEALTTLFGKSFSLTQVDVSLDGLFNESDLDIINANMGAK